MIEITQGRGIVVACEEVCVVKIASARMEFGVDAVMGADCVVFTRMRTLGTQCATNCIVPTTELVIIIRDIIGGLVMIEKQFVLFVVAGARCGKTMMWWRW